MRSSSDTGSPKGPFDSSQTQDAQCNRGHCKAKICVVGIGPGHIGHMSVNARLALESADVIAGYATYIDLIRPLIEGKQVISTGMTKELQRVNDAVDAAIKGQQVALVSSGDAGIYAMASLVLEVCTGKGLKMVSRQVENPSKEIHVEIIPGIPALCSGAALLGAPLTHDFAAISLSDLLTPWQIIEKRLSAAAEADFVIVLYNPKSKKRHWQLQLAQELILAHRSGQTPVGIVTAAMRQDQKVTLTTLDQLHTAQVDMQTTVFIGNSSTRQIDQWMLTPRGYASKYKIDGI
ncbi:MAG: precorrin-3B C(17)-methyltransferase [Desulfobacteraceae bacterium]|nr:precorrin-3B C(17)-methyltransferase [Desulfobacteraceae bacterium]